MFMTATAVEQTPPTIPEHSLRNLVYWKVKDAISALKKNIVKKKILKIGCMHVHLKFVF